VSFPETSSHDDSAQDREGHNSGRYEIDFAEDSHVKREGGPNNLGRERVATQKGLDQCDEGQHSPEQTDQSEESQEGGPRGGVLHTHPFVGADE
jgi:hypothetical protein